MFNIVKVYSTDTNYRDTNNDRKFIPKYIYKTSKSQIINNGRI